jgi:hypothetical protein
MIYSSKAVYITAPSQSLSLNCKPVLDGLDWRRPTQSHLLLQQNRETVRWFAELARVRR